MNDFTPTATEVGSRTIGIEYFMTHLFGKSVPTNVAYDEVTCTFSVFVKPLVGMPSIRITVPSVPDTKKMYTAVKHELRTKYPEYFI